MSEENKKPESAHWWWPLSIEVDRGNGDGSEDINGAWCRRCGALDMDSSGERIERYRLPSSDDSRVMYYAEEPPCHGAASPDEMSEVMRAAGVINDWKACFTFEELRTALGSVKSFESRLADLATQIEGRLDRLEKGRLVVVKNDGEKN